MRPTANVEAPQVTDVEDHAAAARLRLAPRRVVCPARNAEREKLVSVSSLKFGNSRQGLLFSKLRHPVR